MIERLFVPLELARMAKEKGFDEPCFASYDIESNILTTEWSTAILLDFNNSPTYKDVCISAPLYQQLTDWFREKYNVWITFDNPDIKHGICIYRVKWHDGVYKETPFTGNYSQDMLNRALTHAFTLI